MKTGHPIVDAIGDLHFEGNITPHEWYQSPLLNSLPPGSAKHKPNLVAITLLANIIYWYRPAIVRDERTQRIVAANVKFGEHELYLDYQEWADHFGLTKRQVQDAITFLHHRGIIVRTVRKPDIRVYIRPVPDAINRLGEGDTSDAPKPGKARSDSRKNVSRVSNNGKTTHVIESVDAPKSVARPAKKRERSTENTTDKYTDTSTTNGVVVDADPFDMLWNGLAASTQKTLETKARQRIGRAAADGVLLREARRQVFNEMLRGE